MCFSDFWPGRFVRFFAGTPNLRVCAIVYGTTRSEKATRMAIFDQTPTPTLRADSTIVMMDAANRREEAIGAHEVCF